MSNQSCYNLSALPTSSDIFGARNQNIAYMDSSLPAGNSSLRTTQGAQTTGWWHLWPSNKARQEKPVKPSGKLKKGKGAQPPQNRGDGTQSSFKMTLPTPLSMAQKNYERAANNLRNIVTAKFPDSQLSTHSLAIDFARTESFEKDSFGTAADSVESVMAQFILAREERIDSSCRLRKFFKRCFQASFPIVQTASSVASVHKFSNLCANLLSERYTESL